MESTDLRVNDNNKTWTRIWRINDTDQSMTAERQLRQLILLYRLRRSTARIRRIWRDEARFLAEGDFVFRGSAPIHALDPPNRKAKTVVVAVAVHALSATDPGR